MPISPDAAHYRANFCQSVLDEPDLFLAFYKARAVGILLFTNNLGLYSLPEIEQHLYQRTTKQLPLEFWQKSVKVEQQVGFVLTTGYSAGGHTRLLERLASFCAEKPALVVTGSCSQKVLQAMSGLFSGVSGWDLKQPASFAERLQALARHFASFNKLVIFTHPEDLIAIIALRLAKDLKPGLRCYYVNHADHAFSYGVSIADYWFELSAFGHELDKLRPGLNAKRAFLGIPVSLSSLPAQQRPMAEVRSLFTAGSGYKFKPVHGQSLLPLIRKLLQHYPQASVQVIGCEPRRDYWWRPLKGRYGRRLQLHKTLPYPQYMALTQTADVYIDSHPFPGGTAFVEQYLQGKRCIGLISPWRGYSPVELLKQNSPDQVIAALKADLPIEQINQWVLHVHGFEAVSKRFLDCLNVGHCAENPMLALVPQVDVRFGRMDRPQDLEFSRFKPLSSKQSLALLWALKLPVVCYKGLIGKALYQFWKKTYWLWILAGVGLALI